MARGSDARDTPSAARACRRSRWPCALPATSAAHGRRPAAALGRLEIQQPLVDAAELLDAKISIGDAHAARRAGPGRQRQDRPAHDAIVKRDASASGACSRREESSVEGWHVQRAVRQPRWARRAMACSVSTDPDGRGSVSTAITQRLDGVAVAIDRMPPRHEPRASAKSKNSIRRRRIQGLVERDTRTAGAGAALDVCFRRDVIVVNAPASCNSAS